MFIAQVMYAEGLAKVLKTILRIHRMDKERVARITEIQHVIRLLESAETILTEIHFKDSLKTVKKDLAWERENLREEIGTYADDFALLERCGIKPEEYEKKFQLISSDCLRIGHGSVKPPQWQTA